MATGTNIHTYFEKNWHKGNIPIIKKAENYENIFINSGHYRYGLTMAPMSAEEIYKLISESIE